MAHDFMVYQWRKLTDEQRAEVLMRRRSMGRPWHTPPHRNSDTTDAYLFTAACFEHKAHIGHTTSRMASFEESLLDTACTHAQVVIAWVVLPNHYHFLARTSSALPMLHVLGRLHGRVSHQWNGEEDTRGRQVWCRCAETAMKSKGHFWATVNYIHHNPVKHRHVGHWQDWPYSSAARFLARHGPDETEALWRNYPVGEYGKGWDD